MADVYEQNLPQKTNLTTNDYVRVVGSDDVSYKQPLSDVAQKTIENYAGSTLAGSTQSVKGAIDGLKSSATADKAELNASINEVASDLASESSTRASQDTNLQAQINQLVAPTGTAPNPAEIENARIGADNVTYTTLGDAIRTQVANLKSDSTLNLGARLTILDGCVVPKMELGGIAFSASLITFQSVNYAIRTPQLGGIRVDVGDVVSLTDYTNAKYKVAILKDSDSKYAYTDFMTTSYKVSNKGVLFMDVRYSDGATAITQVNELASLIRIDKHNGTTQVMSKTLDSLDMWYYISDKSVFPTDLFEPGDWGNGIHYPNLKKYRVSTINPLTFEFNIVLHAKTGFRFGPHLYVNGVWSDIGWQTEYTIPANTKFGLLIARVASQESSSEIADTATFLSNIITTTTAGNELRTLSELVTPVVYETAIQAHMARFYDSDVAESYIFFTDPHLMGTNGTFSEATFNKYIKALSDTSDRISSDYIVCGGDWLNSGDTKDQASVKLGFVDGQMRSRFPDKYYPLAGNHDFNYLGVDGQGVRLTDDNWVSMSAMRNYWFHEYDDCYYKFKESVAQNYVLNTRTDHDGTGDYDKSMLDWLASNLIEDDAPHSTIMMHLYYLSSVGTTIPTRVKAVGAIISAFNAHTICTLTSATHEYNKTYDFTNTTGHIDYVIVGHTHADFTDTFGGVPIIGCANFQSGDVPTFDLVFADYTNSKVYTTRIGSGSSRSFNI